MKSKRALAAAVLATLCLSAAIGSARADVVLDWNATAAALPIAVPPIHARVMATMHGAMHDAINSIEPQHETYRFPVEAAPSASKDAAAATAAHAVLAALVPAQKAALDITLAQSLAKISDGRSKADGIAVGKAVAERMLAWR
ncbi:MAG: chemotaxis protein CheB, partial [Pseudomonadota bacterium]